MDLIDAASPRFAQHQTFSPRYGWLKSAYDQVCENPLVFTEADAPQTFGVGKNMVQSIKFWAEATKIIQASPVKGSKEYQATDWGHTFFHADGLDPYIEDPGTLWIFHWFLTASPCITPVWWLSFNSFPGIEFQKEHLENFVVNAINEIEEWEQDKDGKLKKYKAPSEASIRKDVAQLLHMYGAGLPKKLESLEDEINSPFRQLKIIDRTEDANGSICRFNRGYKPALSAELIAFIIFDYLSRIDRSTNNINLDSLLKDPGAPGNVLKLTKQDLVDAIQSTGSEKSFWLQNSSAGIRQLYWKGKPEIYVHQTLEKYFGKKALQRISYKELPDDLAKQIEAA